VFFAHRAPGWCALLSCHGDTMAAVTTADRHTQPAPARSARSMPSRSCSGNSAAIAAAKTSRRSAFSCRSQNNHGRERVIFGHCDGLDAVVTTNQPEKSAASDVGPFPATGRPRVRHRGEREPLLASSHSSRSTAARPASRRRSGRCRGRRSRRSPARGAAPGRA
jgi:hypothetical protein